MLTKKAQVSSNRLKPKPFKDPKYLSWLHESEQPSCFVCNINTGVQMHHVKEYSSDHRDDRYIIPLCHNHHLGNELSPHGTPVEFRQVFPMRMQLEFADELYRRYKER